jgi:hypothetical protein
MSTQRREIRTTPTTKTSRWGPRYRWNSAGCSFSAEGIGQNSPSSTARNGLTNANDGTAPPSFMEWLATNSLQSDYRVARVVLFVWLVQLVRLVQLVSMIGHAFKFDTPLGSPPLRAGRRPATGTPAFYRSSPPLPPSLPVFRASF